MRSLTVRDALPLHGALWQVAPCRPPDADAVVRVVERLRQDLDEANLEALHPVAFARETDVVPVIRQVMQELIIGVLSHPDTESKMGTAPRNPHVRTVVQLLHDMGEVQTWTEAIEEWERQCLIHLHRFHTDFS